MRLQYQIEGGDFATAGSASTQLKRVLKQLNLDPAVIRRCVISLYEAEMNVVAHAYRGEICVTLDPGSICMQVEDEGPGIADIGKAMQEGFSTASPRVREMGFGAGMGLPNMKKNSDLLEIESTPGKGTRVMMWIYIQQKP